MYLIVKILLISFKMYFTVKKPKVFIYKELQYSLGGAVESRRTLNCTFNTVTNTQKMTVQKVVFVQNRRIESRK